MSSNPYSEEPLGKEFNKHVETTMNVSKNVRKFSGPLPFVIRRPRMCAGCHPGPLSYHVSGSDDTEIMKEVIMTDSDMDSVSSDWRPFLYFKDKMGGGKRSLPSSSEEINGVSTKQVQTLQYQPSGDEDREVDVNYLFDPRIDPPPQNKISISLP